jgi:hypothetical protein
VTNDGTAQPSVTRAAANVTGQDSGESAGAVRTPADFVAYVGDLHDLAEKFRPGQDTAQLVLQYLRHPEYDSYQWRALVGPVDEDFVRQVDATGLEHVKFIADEVFPVSIKTTHLAAACTGVYEQGRPEPDTTNRGDVTGWAGDFITFYGDWRREHHTFPSGYEFSKTTLMQAGIASTFELTDLVEDADAYLMGMALRGGDNIVEAMRALYGAGARLPRLARFFEGRFGDKQTAQAAARYVLTSDEDLLVALGRTFLVEQTGGIPSLLPDMIEREHLDELCRGFADVLVEKVAEETALLARPVPPTPTTPTAPAAPTQPTVS